MRDECHGRRREAKAATRAASLPRAAASCVATLWGDWGAQVQRRWLCCCHQPAADSSTKCMACAIPLMTTVQQRESDSMHRPSHAPGGAPATDLGGHTGQRAASSMGACSRSSTHFSRSCTPRSTEADCSSGHGQAGMWRQVVPRVWTRAVGSCCSCIRLLKVKAMGHITGCQNMLRQCFSELAHKRPPPDDAGRHHKSVHSWHAPQHWRRRRHGAPPP